MAKSHTDRIQDEVNRRISYAAAAAGLARGRVELEVLFLLPPEFTRQYQELFRRALDDPVTRGDGGKDEGRIKASGKPLDEMKARSMGAAKSGGRRFVAGHWPVRNETALEAKRRLDRQLILAVEKAVRAAGDDQQTVPASRLKCPACGLFQAASWQRCPYHL